MIQNSKKTFKSRQAPFGTRSSEFGVLSDFGILDSDFSTPRRRFLIASACAALAPISILRGADNPLASFDREMEAFMKARGTPGGALAVVRNRKLIYARGYGWANRENKTPVQADSLFRIASVSKPITSAAVLKLVERGKLKFEDRAFDFLHLSPAPANAKPDPRLAQITIRQLLQHTGGWNRDKSGDPMFRSDEIASVVGTSRPAGPEAIIRYMMGRPLDFAPGAEHAYSNFGYCVLGRIIERVTGLRYDEFVKREILAPAGVKRMRIGASLENQAAPGEVKYYPSRDIPQPSVFPQGPRTVPAPYGSFHLEAMDSHGAWIASAVDLMRFVVALENPAQGPLLKPATLADIMTPPPAPVGRKDDGSVKEVFYGLGWSVRPTGRKNANLWHNGSLPGTNTLLVRLSGGMSWAALFNYRSANKDLPDGAIDPALHRAAAAVTTWPEEDLFPKFG